MAMALDKDKKRIVDNGCAAFQSELPHLMESNADLSEQDHLHNCASCSSLVADLQYIADQAKLLLPLHDPSPQVWTNIKGTLTNEGLMNDDDGGLGVIKKKLVQARR
jgi:hypothetical protein